MAESSELPPLDSKHLALQKTEPADLKKMEEEYRAVLGELRKIRIEDNDDFDFVGEQLRKISGTYKEIEARRKIAVAPGNAVKLIIQGWYKPSLNFLDQCKSVLKKEIGRYSLELSRKNEAAMHRAAEASRRNDFEASQQAVQNVRSKPEKKGISVIEKWGYQVTSKLAVPDEYKVLNHQKLEKHCKGKDKPSPIPGIAFYKDANVTARAK